MKGITSNGRPQEIGGVFVDGQTNQLKFCAGYCPDCKKKIGITIDDMKKLYIPTKTTYKFLRILHFGFPR